MHDELVKMRAATFQFCVIWLSFVVVIADNACSQVSKCNNCYNDSGTHRCTQCDDGYYGDKCSRCQSNCVKCVSWNNCSACVTGYYGTWCSVQCDPNCVQTECYQYNGTCVHGCPGGYYQDDSRCYNCSIHNCEECSDLYHCTRCASGYNLWPSDSYTYCNVDCSPGTWGVQCQYNCSSNCSDTGCDETNGHCDRCTKYTYGEKCNFRCSDGCNDTGANVCNKVSGQCMKGCKPGYSGSQCETAETAQAVDGQWGQWSEYGPCSVTCGSGSISRTRSCDNPAPQNGGQPCIGSNVETTDCNLSYCPGGQWGLWTDYGPCSVTCGWGLRSRTRSCDQPALQNGGHSCSGKDGEATDCHPSSCPDTRSETAENDSLVGVAVGGVFGGAVVGFVGGLLVGYCIYKKKCWRRGQNSGNLDNTYTPTSVAYVNITDTAGSVIVPGNESGVPTYESLDPRTGPDTIYTGLETKTS